MASAQRTRVAVSAVLCYSVVRYLCGLYLRRIPRARESRDFTNNVWNCMFACRVCFCLPLCVNAVRSRFVLPSSASFLSPSSFALAHLCWSAHVVPPGVSLLLFASVPVSSRCTLLKLHLTLSFLGIVACTFSSLTSHCRLTCNECFVHYICPCQSR